MCVLRFEKTVCVPNAIHIKAISKPSSSLIQLLSTLDEALWQWNASLHSISFSYLGCQLPLSYFLHHTVHFIIYFLSVLRPILNVNQVFEKVSTRFSDPIFNVNHGFTIKPSVRESVRFTSFSPTGTTHWPPPNWQLTEAPLVSESISAPEKKVQIQMTYNTLSATHSQNICKTFTNWFL